MKIITSKMTLLIILSTITVVSSSLTVSQTSMAANIDENSVSLNSISAQNLDTTATTATTSSASDSNQYQTSFVWSNPSTSKMTDVLTASFTNILDTQIYTGLDKITN
jgi:cytoskeletal protein RodZ